MQPRHRRDKTQSQAAARLRPARFQPDEAAEHPLTIGSGHARSAVGDDNLGDRTFGYGPHLDLRLRAGAVPGRLRRAIFDRVVDQIGDGLPEQLAVGADDDRRIGLGLEHKPRSSATGS